MARDVRLIRSPVSVAGMILTTISAVVFIIVLLGDLFGLHTNPYIGIIFFLVLPALFVIGLLLIPLGAWIERRRRAAGKPATVDWPRIDFNNPSHRRVAVILFALTMVNIVIVALGAYKGVEYMDSVGFCGQTCHTPMKPELAAHLQGPHAHVSCVACHIGPGARGFAKAKLAGTRQLVEVSLNNYPRPIIASPDDLVASLDTCVKCHEPGRFRGEITHRIREYADDEKNTESVTTLRLHVGGRDAYGKVNGIHWHADPNNVVEYVATDEQRQTIPWVKVTRGGEVREYAVKDAAPDRIPGGVRRRMECTDCHNRPSHAIAATANKAVDLAIARGDIVPTLPFVRRESVKALGASYGSEEAALAGISSALRGFYQGQPGHTGEAGAKDLDRAVVAVQGLYSRSVFPDMKVTFGTYPNHIGHTDAPGCFRCHDDDHVTKAAKPIGQDCETCHVIE
jgi:hypothetical protein